MVARCGAAAPTSLLLTAALVNNELALSWPVTDFEFRLQSQAALGGPWKDVPNLPALNAAGDRYLVTLPIEAAAQFFRLTSEQPNPQF